MSVLNNKFMGALVALNIVILLAVVWLVGALTGFKINQSSTEAAVTAVMQKRGLITTDPAAITDADDKRITQDTFNAPPPSAQVKVTEEPSYNHDAIIRRNEIDSQGNLHILISNALHGKNTEEGDDATYIASLDSLTPAAHKRPKAPTISKQTAVLHTIHKKSNRSSVDHYNKIKASTAQRPTSLADQIQGLVNQAIGEQSIDTQTSYLKSLEKASQERINESRTVTVRPGDTLWTLAVRAYGDGFQYPRIFNANPHLLNPDQVEVGEILRVPLISPAS